MVGPERLEPRTLLSGAALTDLGSGTLKVSYPVAGDDYYWTPADTPLHVSAPGLLANDYDPDGHPIEAINFYGLDINLELKYGFLDMGFWRDDGSFDYYPDPGAAGREIFIYTCMDQYGYMVEATVTIDVGDFNRPPFVADPIDDVTVDQGAPDMVIDLDAVFDDLDIPDGDQLTYNVTVSPPVLPIVEEVSQSSYEHILSNTNPGESLFTHLGDDRGYYPGEVDPERDHDPARENIKNYFESLGLVTNLDIIPEVEDLGGTYVFDPPLVNVVGVKIGEKYPEDVYLVGAHYDSVNNPGADDNASGVAAVMEIARVLSAHTFDCTLVFVAFDGEEMGLYGSLHYVEYHDSDQNIAYTGTHDGEDNQSVLIDSTAFWTNDALIGFTLTNLADGSKGSVTANTATTITAVLSGGSENDWDAGDSYRVEFSSEILGMVNLDMIAYNQPGEDHDVVSILDGDAQGNVKPNLISALSTYGGGLTARDEGTTSLSDHFYFDFFGIDAAMAIESAMGSVTNNPYYHRQADAVDTPEYIDYAYATKITRGVTGYLAQAAKPLGNVDLLSANVADHLLTLDYDPSESGSAVVTVRATDSEGLFVEDSFSVTVNISENQAAVIGRHVFYNNSSFDGNDPAANPGDDGAIAPPPDLTAGHGPHPNGQDEIGKQLGKSPLLPGQTATFANYTSYRRGINGIMVDLASPADPAGIGAGDFWFRVGNDDSPGTWDAAPDPQSITVREVDADTDGVADFHRVTIIWADHAIQSQWVQVTVLATDPTGLPQDDVFYFGNAVGESGEGNTSEFAFVTVADELGARNSLHSFLNPATISDPYDFNRDSYVTVSDELTARSNGTSFLDALRLITVPLGAAGGNAAATLENAGQDMSAADPSASTIAPSAYESESSVGSADPSGQRWSALSLARSLVDRRISTDSLLAAGVSAVLRPEHGHDARAARPMPSNASEATASLGSAATWRPEPSAGTRVDRTTALAAVGLKTLEELAVADKPAARDALFESLLEQEPDGLGSFWESFSWLDEAAQPDSRKHAFSEPPR